MPSYTNKVIFNKEEKLMSKKIKVLISILVAALLLTMGGVTMVMAEGKEETTPPSEASAKGFLERVADILEIDQEDLIDAFKQAKQEMKEEAFINRLNQAVAEGRITQEQADEIMEWWKLKPEVIKPGMGERALRFRASPRFHMLNGHRGGFCPRLPRLAD